MYFNIRLATFKIAYISGMHFFFVLLERKHKKRHCQIGQAQNSILPLDAIEYTYFTVFFYAFNMLLFPVSQNLFCSKLKKINHSITSAVCVYGVLLLPSTLFDPMLILPLSSCLSRSRASLFVVHSILLEIYLFSSS